MAGRQVDPRRVADLGEAREERPLGVLLRAILVLVGGEAGADERARNVAPGVIGQLRAFADERARLRHRTLAERRELRLAEAVEVLLLGHGRPVHRLLDLGEVGIERTDARCRVDVDHRDDVLGNAVARGIPGEARGAVEREDDRAPGGDHGVADCIDVVGERDVRAVGVLRLEAGERDRRDVVAVRSKRFGNLVPCPGAEPETGNENNRCGAHGLCLPLRRGIPGSGASPSIAP